MIPQRSQVIQDVNSAFLHGEPSEDVFVEQPQGYEKKGQEHKVYKLKKALYGLKQAPELGIERFKHTLSEKVLKSVNMNTPCSLNQMRKKKYAREVLEKFGMDKSNPVKNPIVLGSKLTRDEGGVRVDTTLFKQVVGNLMYLTSTRPDLMYSVSLISRYVESPTEMHWQTTKRILRYVRGTVDLGILYKKQGNKELMAYTDSDYARDIDDRKSTSRYVFKLSSGVVAWSSKKQSVFTLLTTEAEFIAATSCTCQSIWMKMVLEKLGKVQNKCTTLFCDNSSTINLSKNPVMHGRSEHIDVRFHFLRGLSKDGMVKLVYCSSQEQVADIMTKPLKLDVFLKLRNLFGVCSVHAVN
ncbi:Ubiquitin carboxyl-terminal hydrolase family protein [Hibiscus syriacus]|uniref:Ubiquitin carboxyl-terminal hydrolase family protein n=1 Tax=Hibiscus syriacus TaxID=106335 RepID=A0A6A2WXN1_HIBSY|nr:Ubiquitin carboxyl-terminal hydrolase family protein [Hibiscus syriacus]